MSLACSLFAHLPDFGPYFMFSVQFLDALSYSFILIFEIFVMVDK